MKKNSKKLIVTIMIVLSIALSFAAFSACSGCRDDDNGILPQLDMPILVFDASTRILSWDEVLNAVNYQISIDGVTQTTAYTKLDLTEFRFEEGNVIDILVTAIANTDTHRNSVAAPFRYVASTEGLSFNLVYFTFWEGLQTETKYILGYSVSRGTADLTGTIYIPSIHNDLPVIEIESRAFLDATELNNIVISSTIERIGLEAFRGTGLYNNVTHGSVVYADNWAIDFYGNRADVTAITVREGTVGVADHAFDNMQRLVSAQMPSTLQFLGANAFRNSLEFTTMNTPSSLRSIGVNAFNNTAIWNHGHGEITIGNWIVGFRGNFTGAVGVQSGVRGIADQAFNGAQISEISIPASVIFMGSYVFVATNVDITILGRAERPNTWCVSWWSYQTIGFPTNWNNRL